MDADALAERLLQDPRALEQLAEPLPDQLAAVVVARLKAEADRHWWINANRSLELAELIEQIGHRRADMSQIALGLLARGNAYVFLGQAYEAWECFDRSGKLYESARDSVGWARTRIGRLLICVDLNRVSEALGDADRAREIFVCHDHKESVLRLNLNSAIVYGSLGQHEQALTLFRAALATAQALGEQGHGYLGLLHTNIGHVYDLLGDLQQALTHHQQARAIFAERNERRGVALADVNDAHIAVSQGQYRRALQLLHHAYDLYLDENLKRDATDVGCELVECYLLLNRYAEARSLALQVIAAYRELGASYREAVTSVHLAVAQAELADLEAALQALDAAETIFVALGASTWIATVRHRRSRIALQQGDINRAIEAAAAAGAIFETAGQQVEYARSLVLRGQAALAGGELATAAMVAAEALNVALQQNVPELRYAAHLLLGRIAEARRDFSRARRRYQAATATIERVQRGLTITLRSEFLENKGEALQALIALHLRSGRGLDALEALERAKSQALFSYLTDRTQLRWAPTDPQSHALVNELNRLREVHRRLYRQAHPQPDEVETRGAMIPEHALSELTVLERRMRHITEQLYLATGKSEGLHVDRFSLSKVQQRLDDNALLLEYYDDGAQMWAFSVDKQQLEVHRLPIDVATFSGLLRQLQVNIGAALARPNNPGMTLLARRILRRLHAALLEPLAHRLAGRQRLLIVPHGSLHYLPFHLLYSGNEYLLEQHEVVVLPAAGLASRRSPQRSPGVRVLAHSWNGRLPKAHVEAQAVQQLFGGELYQELAAVRGVLKRTPTQILHIAAHGEHRLDQPDLSYIELADGQMYADDLLQQDLGYELVTLSACETGRARVAARDELIGLGRGFLYAGAGALITSLWQVPDDISVMLMRRMYASLWAGVSKAAALRNAQLQILHEDPQLHPALWGAFQLVGDAGPLSQASSAIESGEAIYATDAVGAA